MAGWPRHDFGQGQGLGRGLGRGWGRGWGRDWGLGWGRDWGRGLGWDWGRDRGRDWGRGGNGVRGACQGPGQGGTRMTTPGTWHDLETRVLSAIAMVVIGGFAVFSGGWLFLLLVLLAVAGMIWELARMTAPETSPWTDFGLGVLAFVSLFLWTAMEWPPIAWAILALPVLGLVLTPRRDRWVIGLYGLGVMLASAGFLIWRNVGIPAFLWLLLVVVASDVLGYFAGRLLGGPKFWPAVSPKKTWAGTVAGWIGAMGVGLVFARYTAVPPSLLLFSPLVALAGQFGDIAESWIKRRAGVKDASDLIPGHGGLLDRFDALLGAMLAVQLIMLVVQGRG